MRSFLQYLEQAATKKHEDDALDLAKAHLRSATWHSVQSSNHSRGSSARAMHLQAARTHEAEAAKNARELSAKYFGKKLGPSAFLSILRSQMRK